MGLNWLITGGCGFLGTSLIRHIQGTGEHTIRVIDNLSVGSRKDLEAVCNFSEQITNPEPGEVQLIVGDILDEELAFKCCENIDVVVHFAANTGVAPSVENPRMDCMANVIGTFNYLEAARQQAVKRFVFASSGAPVGEVHPPIHEELPAHPVSPYGASKLAGEGYCSAYFRTYGLETVALRFGNVYGPGSLHKSSVVAKFIKLALEGKVLEIYGDGSQTRDFIYIDDLIDAVWKAAHVKSAAGEIFQIATNSETSLSEMVESLKEVLLAADIKVPEIRYAEKRLGDVMRNFSDTSKAKETLEWKVKVDLETGLKNTLEYFMPITNIHSAK